MRAAEEQKQSATALQTVPQGDSTPITRSSMAVSGQERAEGCLAKLL